MSRLRILLAALLGVALTVGMLAPAAHADQKVWVAGTGVADLDGTACEDGDPANAIFASVFTSRRGEDRGLNGCWYFDYSTAAPPMVIKLRGGRYKAIEYLDEWFQGTLNGEEVYFETDGAVVVTYWQGEPFAEGSEQLAGGCWHPLDDEFGSGGLVFVEQVDAEVPTVRYFGRIAVG